jgi:hypothetical protein
VRFSPKDTKAWLDDISNQIGRKLVGVAKEKANEVGNAVLAKARQQRGNSGMFWALPYIGVEEGLYIGK